MVIFVSFIVTTVYCFIEFSGFARYLSPILMTYIYIKIVTIPFNSSLFIKIFFLIQRLVLFGRVVRIIRSVILIRLFYTEPRNVRKGVRQAVSENKRRFRTSLFDLDLTYVTDQMIVMSFPSSGK